MKRLLMFLTISLIATVGYGDIVVPEINPEYSLIVATSTEKDVNWQIFIWDGTEYKLMEYRISKDEECITTGPPGVYLMVDGHTWVTFTIGDPPPPDINVSVNDIQVTEGNSGVTPATFTISLNKPAKEALTVNYATENGTADEKDYKAVQGTLTFKPGETQKLVTVEILGDTDKEEDETFLLNLTSTSKLFGFTKDSGTCTIVNDDDPTPPTPEDFEGKVYKLGMSLPPGWYNALNNFGKNYDAVAAEAAATNMTVEQMIGAVKTRNINTTSAEDIESIRDIFFKPLAELIVEEDIETKEEHIEIWKSIATALKRIK